MGTRSCHVVLAGLALTHCVFDMVLMLQPFRSRSTGSPRPQANLLFDGCLGCFQPLAVTINAAAIFLASRNRHQSRCAVRSSVASDLICQAAPKSTDTQGKGALRALVHTAMPPHVPCTSVGNCESYLTACTFPRPVEPGMTVGPPPRRTCHHADLKEGCADGTWELSCRLSKQTAPVLAFCDVLVWASLLLSFTFLQGGTRGRAAKGHTPEHPCF